ncbi:hypothetical protein BT69DRAFT_927386 [Atractiella rhizophila]|nr:hypothetical protein BT69DRAFT_927386 [Atractiella rhizophila]
MIVSISPYSTISSLMIVTLLSCIFDVCLWYHMYFLSIKTPALLALKLRLVPSLNSHPALPHF